MDLKPSSIDHVALALDTMDMNDADDFELTEKESKQWFGGAVGSNDISITCLCLFTLNVGTYKMYMKMFPLHGKPLIRSSVVYYDISYTTSQLGQ